VCFIHYDITSSHLIRVKQVPLHSGDVQGMVVEQCVRVPCFRVIIGYRSCDDLDIWHCAKVLQEWVYRYGCVRILGSIDSLAKTASVTVGV